MSTLTTQSKVEENKVNQAKSSSPKQINTVTTMDNNISTILNFYAQTIEIPTEQVKQNLKTWLTVFDSDVILEAMNRTQSKGKSFVYLNAILTDFKQKEVKTIKDIKEYDESFKHKQQNYTKPSPRKESLPGWAYSGYTIKDELVDGDVDKRFKNKLEKIRAKNSTP